MVKAIAKFENSPEANLTAFLLPAPDRDRAAVLRESARLVD